MSRIIRHGSAPGVSRRTMLQTGAAAGVFILGGAASRQAFAQQALLWYSASSVESVEDWTKVFKERTGTTVEFFRAGGVKLAQKFEQEAKAGQVRCDFIDISLPGLLTQWAHQGLLMKYDSPEAKHYPADLRMDGYWTPVKALDTCMAFNSGIIGEADAPKHWEELLDPKWKGKMVMADPFFSGGALHWYYAVRKLLGKAYMEKLAKQNVLLRNGSGEVIDTVISGERPLAASALQYYASQKAAEGVKIRMVFPSEGVPSGMEVIGITSKAPNPDGAKKFYDFALSKPAQESWQKRFFAPSLRDDVAPMPDEFGRTPLNKVKLIFSSAADTLEVHEKQGELLDEFGALFK
jgi:iron(III) transport system substrate-binding protein